VTRTPDVSVTPAEEDIPGPVVEELPPPEPECVAHADCDDGNACTEDLCSLDETGVPACTQTQEGCPGAGEPCLETSCDPASGCASWLASSEACCFDAVLAEWTFEEEGEEVVIDPTVGGVSAAVWHRSVARSFTGQSSYLFAIPDQERFDGDEPVAGRLTMAGVALSAETRPELRFHVWPDVTEGGTWDLLVVYIDNGNGGLPVWSKTQDNLVMREWNTVTVDLAAFAGTSVWVSFTFGSAHHGVHDGEGIYLDDVWVWTGCKGLECDDALPCEDDLACTDSACVDGVCAYTPVAGCCALDADCFDGDHCTADLCLAAVCSSTPTAVAECCNTSADCDDGDPCTQDLCVPGELYTCEHQAVAPGGAECPAGSEGQGR